MKQSDNVMYYVDQLPSTIESIEKFEAHFISEMEDKNPLQIAVQLKALEELVKRLRANNRVRNYIMSEVDKYPEKIFENNVAKFEKAETNVKYNYSKCNDTVINDLMIEQQEQDKKIKKRQEFLKNLDIDNPVADTKTGEILNKPLKMSNSYVKITLK